MVTGSRKPAWNGWLLSQTFHPTNLYEAACPGGLKTKVRRLCESKCLSKSQYRFFFSNALSRMMLNLKSTFLLALWATTIPATPAPFSLDPKDTLAGKPIKDVKCNGKEWKRDQIVASIQQSRTQHGKYPEKYNNHEGIFGTKKQLWEFPLTDPVYTSEFSQSDLVFLCYLGAFSLLRLLAADTAILLNLEGEPGPYRVVVDDGYSYVGCMVEKAGAVFEKCDNA